MKSRGSARGASCPTRGATSCALVATMLQRAAGRRESAPPQGPPPAREMETVRLVGLGLGNKEIARRLGVSVATVRTHLGKVYGKLGTASRVELALLAAHVVGNVM